MPGTSNGITPDRVGADGKIKVWDIPTRRWVRVAPVNAREMIEAREVDDPEAESGKRTVPPTASLTGPDVEIQGPAGKIVVCESEVETYLSQGYVRVESESPTTKKSGSGSGGNSQGGGSGSGGGGSGSESANPFDFASQDVETLRAWGLDAGIANAKNMKKSQLVEALEKSDYKPKIDPGS